MNTPFDWRDMLRFDKMIAPTFLTILYYVHVSLVSLFWLATISDGMSDSGYSRTFGLDGGKLVMIGLVGLVVSPFLIRLGYEILIVIFKIYSRLGSIDQSLQVAQPLRSQAPIQPPPYTNPVVTASSEHDLATALPTNMNLVDSEKLATGVPGGAPVHAEIPTGDSGAGGGLADFWNVPQAAQSHRVAPAKAQTMDFENVKSKIPNWPAAIAAIFVMYAVMVPYAQIDLGVPIIGNILGKSYSIKDSSLGMVAVLGAIGMLIATIGGTKWNVFIISYALTIVATLIALLGDGSVFSDIRNVKSGVAQAGAGLSSALGQFIPQTENIGNQIASNAPGASQFLSFAFYLFILSMAFLAYWGFSGRYHDKGLINQLS